MRTLTERRQSATFSLTLRRPATALHLPLEKAVLNFGVLHELGAFFVIMSRVIDPVAYGIAPHLPSIEGPQQFGYRVAAGTGIAVLAANVLTTGKLRFARGTAWTSSWYAVNHRRND